MKKLFISSFASLALCGSLFAASLDENSVKVGFEGYKTPAMVGTKGVFSKVNLKLNKDTTSLSKQLVGSTITLSPKDIDMGGEVNQVITDNVVNAFFGTLNNKGDIKVSIEDVIEGEHKGVINAKVTINKQSQIVPLVYEISGNNEFSASGRLDLSAFSNSKKALKALSEVAAGHLGISWNIVDISVSGKLK